MGGRGLAVLIAGVVAAVAMGDNAALTSGGLPKMMVAHPSIRMAQEDVTVTMHADHVDTECIFRFTNDGVACTVNMGFPDFGLWAYAITWDKPRSMFKRFQSYVDGKPVPTKLVRGSAPGEQWQTKLVRFPSHGTRIVKELYRTELGGIADKILVCAASYILHTGASWKGNIGKATVIVTFAPDSEVALPLVSYVNPLGSPSQEARDQYLANMEKPGAVFPLCKIKPEIKGNSLIFRRDNWRPSKDDDILVFFHYPRSAYEKLMKDARTKHH